MTSADWQTQPSNSAYFLSTATLVLDRGVTKKMFDRWLDEGMLFGALSTVSVGPWAVERRRWFSWAERRHSIWRPIRTVLSETASLYSDNRSDLGLHLCPFSQPPSHFRRMTETSTSYKISKLFGVPSFLFFEFYNLKNLRG